MDEVAPKGPVTVAFTKVPRMIMLASIAKAQGMQWSQAKGLVNRETKGSLLQQIPMKLQNVPFDQGASNRANPDKRGGGGETQQSAQLRQDPDYEQLVADFKKNIEAQGLPMPEAKTMRQGIMIAEKNILSKKQ